MKVTKIRIEDMIALNCVTHVQRALEAVPGVTAVEVTSGEGARVTHEGASDEQLLRAVRSAGDFAGVIEPA